MTPVNQPHRLFVDPRLAGLLESSEMEIAQKMVKIALDYGDISMLTFGKVCSIAQEAFMIAIDTQVAQQVGIKRYQAFLSELAWANAKVFADAGFVNKLCYCYSVSNSWKGRRKALRAL